MRHSAIYPFCVLLLLFAALNSCSSNDDDEEKKEEPKQEDKEVVVTGSNVEAGITYAILTGDVYLDRVPAAITSTKDEGTLKVGVELSTRNDFGANNTRQLLASGLEGSKLTVSVDMLSANTTYYYRAFFRKGDFSLYGAKQSFTTKDFDSPVLNGEVEDITFTSAKVSYSIPDVSLAEGETIGTVIAYSTDKKDLNSDNVHLVTTNYGNRQVTWEGVSFTSGNLWLNLKDNAASETLDKLQPDQTYYYCLFTCTGSKFRLSEVKSFKTRGVDASLLSTGDANNITFATATVAGTAMLGTISQLYDGNVSLSCGISYAPKDEDTEMLASSNMPFQTTSVLQETKDGSFTMELTGLTPETTYLYRSFIRIGQVILVGDVKRFTTKATKDYMYVNVSDIGFNTATFEGKILLPNTFKNVGYTLTYVNKTDDYGWGEQQATPTINGGTVTATLRGLYIGRTYEYWLTAMINGKNYQSEKKTFTTQNPGNYIILDEPSNIKSTSAVVSGYLDPKAYDTENSCQIYYGTDKDNLFQLTTAPVSNDRFKTEIKNLRSNTTYYYRVQALCHLVFGGADWFSSEIKSFTTLP